MEEIYFSHFPETEGPICDEPDPIGAPPGDFGANLRRARWDRDLSIRKVARAVGIQRTVLNRYEINTMQSVRINHLYKLCKFYNMTADELLGFNGRLK